MGDQLEQLKKDREYVEEQNEKLLPRDLRKKRINKILLTVVFILFNIGAIVVTGILDITRDSSSASDIQMQDVNLFFLFAAFGCLALALFLESFKYHVMMRGMLGRSNFKHAFEVAALGKYYDSVTPSGAGGQPFQIYYLRKAGYSAGVAGSLPVMGFLSMQVGFVILAVIAMIFGGSYLAETLGDYASTLKAAASVGILFYLFVPLAIILFTIAPGQVTRFLRWGLRLLGKMHLVKNPDAKEAKMVESLSSYRSSVIEMVKIRFLIPKVLLIGILYQIALCSIPFFVLRAFGSTHGYFASFFITVYIYSSITFIPTPGNAGAAEGIFYACFSRMLSKYLFWAQMIWRFLSYYIFLLLGVGIYGFNAIQSRRRAAQAGQLPKSRDE